MVLTAELQVSAGSRAIVFTRRTLEILQQVGVADAAAVPQGLPWRFGNSFYRGQRVFRMEAPHDDDDRFCADDQPAAAGAGGVPARRLRAPAA